MGSIIFLGFHFLARFNTQYDFVIFSFLVSLDTISLLKLVKMLRKKTV